MLLIIDWNRTLFNPSSGTLYDDSIPFLIALKEKNIRTIIASAAETNWELETMAPIENLVERIVIGKKTPEMFRTLGENEIASHVFVIGDYIYNEIAIGNRCGYTTVQILRDIFQTLSPRHRCEYPHYQIHSLNEALPLFSSSSTDS